MGWKRNINQLEDPRLALESFTILEAMTLSVSPPVATGRVVGAGRPVDALTACQSLHRLKYPVLGSL